MNCCGYKVNSKCHNKWWLCPDQPDGQQFFDQSVRDELTTNDEYVWSKQQWMVGDNLRFRLCLIFLFYFFFFRLAAARAGFLLVFSVILK
jgi:hypothetical protein